MGIGLQLYSIRESVKENAMDALKSIAQIGYKNIEFANHSAEMHPGCGFPMEAKELKELLDSLGLQTISCHVHPLTLETIYPVLSYQLEMGNQNIVFGTPFFSCEDDVVRHTEPLNEIASIANKHGVMTYYHNHFHEF